ncbi:MAG: hypothetical protein NWF08_05430 [Candidatus Bathyarchaeota archaeon]|nr:hypothetical protein [Candidatus Bathyarchaeota archaeon]
MRKILVCSLILVMVLSLAMKTDFGFSETEISNISTSNFDITLEFPATEVPDNSVTIHFNADSKNYVRVKEIVFKVSVHDKSGNLREIFSETIMENSRLDRGDTIQKSFSFRIPGDAQRGALIGEVSETTGPRTYSSYYSFYPSYYYNYNYSSTYPYAYYYYPYSYEPYYYSPYYNEPYYYTPYYEPYYSTSRESTDSKITSLTYVLASTPEYEELKTEYDSLSIRYEELSYDNDELSEDLDIAKTEILNLENTQLEILQDLDSSNYLKYTFGISTIALAILAGLLGFMLLNKNSTKKRKSR